jgi:hypothetical protein
MLRSSITFKISKKKTLSSSSEETLTTSKHDDAPRIPMVTKGHKLTGVTPVAKTDQHSQTSHL